MILIISIVIGVSSNLSTVDVSGGTGSGDSEVVLPPNIDITPTDPDENIEKPPTFSNGFQAIDYAMNIMKNGKGFSSFFNQEVRTMGQTQKIYAKKTRTANQNISEEWYYIDFSFGENAYKCFYTDGTNMKIKTVTDKSKYNAQELTFVPCKPNKLEEFPYTDWTGTMNRSPLNNFFTTVNSSSARILYFDKSDKTDFIVKVQMNANKIDETYFTTFSANGAKNVKIQNLTLTFHINKKTGYMSKIIKDERITATYAGFADIACDNTSTEIFTAMNVDLTDKINEEFRLNFES